MIVEAAPIQYDMHVTLLFHVQPMETTEHQIICGLFSNSFSDSFALFMASSTQIKSTIGAYWNRSAVYLA